MLETIAESPSLLFLIIIGIVLVGLAFIFLLRPNWFRSNTAHNMNEVRHTLVKADKNKTYRVGIYVEGNLSEVFLSLLKNSLHTYKLPVVVVPLHRDAGRNLLFEGEWLNRIAYPDEKMVDLVAVMELHENQTDLQSGLAIYPGLEAAFYHPTGACANRLYRVAQPTLLNWLAYSMAIEIAKALREAVINPRPAPEFSGNPNLWPYDEEAKEKAVWPQNTPR